MSDWLAGAGPEFFSDLDDGGAVNAGSGKKVSLPSKPKTEDGRNIIDYYWYWKQEDILAHLNERRLPYAVMVSNLFNDFNISTVIRNCNAFVAKETYYYGKKRFDKRGAVGMHLYERIRWIPTEEELDSIQGYTWVGVDNVPGATPIDEYEWPTNALIVFGQEQVGVPPELLKRCKDVVYIRQYGATRSLNIGCASAIAMQSYCTQHQNLLPPELKKGSS